MRAVAHPHGPRGSVVVGYDLYLDMARTLHQLLHENGCVPKGLERLGARAFKCPRKLVRGMHPSNPVTTTAGSGFYQERIAKTLRVAHGIVDGLYRPVTPQRNGYLRLLGQTLGGDLVTQPAHGVAIRADEHNAHLATKVREIRMLGHKAPSHPRRVGARAFHRRFQRWVIDVGALGLIRGWIGPSSGTERHCFVRLADKHGVAIRLGIERDRRYRCAVFPIELTRRVNETYRGFTAVDDDYPLKFALHNPSDRYRVAVPQFHSSRRDVLQSLQWLSIDAVGKRHRPVTGQAQVPVSLRIHNFRVELFARSRQE